MAPFEHVGASGSAGDPRTSPCYTAPTLRFRARKRKTRSPGPATGSNVEVAADVGKEACWRESWWKRVPGLES